MNSYVADYIDVCGDTKKDEYLVKALVEVIASDATIDTNQPFYVCEDGSALTKAQICAASELCLLSNDEMKRQVLGIFADEIYKSLRNA